jgi:tRNA A37 threonylcarbamoyladenosine dehydratase
MADRLAGINPECRVFVLDEFVSPENVQSLLASDLTLLIDCTDQVSAKVAMVLEAAKRKLPMVVCGGAGGKTSLARLRAGDLSQALNDSLLAKLRNSLRRQHGYPKASDAAGKPRKRIPRMHVRSLWFDQATLLPAQWRADDQTADAGGLQGLSCAGYGSVVTVTATMGMAAAGEAIYWLLNHRFEA